ncbi:MAG: helix-turn-helix domain-containing protein [Kiloniellales bacterium]
MRYGPDIARVAALIGDPARANILTALMGGSALTASELANESGVTKQTASAHLAKLLEADFVAVEKQGRHRYYRLADPDVAQILEGLMGIAARRNPTRVRTGPKEPALRMARVCYDHLAGELAVLLFESLVRKGWLEVDDDKIRLTTAGRAFFDRFGVDLETMERRRRPVCRACLDWSVRRRHLAGALGAGLLSNIYELGWARRLEGSRIVEFSPSGEAAYRKQFDLRI